MFAKEWYFLQVRNKPLDDCKCRLLVYSRVVGTGENSIYAYSIWFLKSKSLCVLINILYKLNGTLPLVENGDLFS